jgi:hypothetical protein
VQVDHLGYPDFPNPFPPEPAQPFICIGWDMRVEQSAGAAGATGPFFGIEAYDGAAATGLLASLGVDATAINATRSSKHIVLEGLWGRN